jgi:hypothetical protein
MTRLQRSEARQHIVLAASCVIAAAVIAATVARAADSPAKEPQRQPQKPAKPADKYAWRSLFDGKSLDGWKKPEFGGEGKVYVKDGAIVIDRGDMMSGIAWAGGELPKVDYELALEGKRIDGSDFFCTTTFPVENSFCSLVVGGWGGTVVGLSSINGYDASENETNKFHEFKSNQWYKIRIRVTKTAIQAWIDDEKMVDLDREGKKISIRWECEPCRPLGIATWCTAGAVRDLRIRLLKPEEIKPEP